jgi:hypothetical protein
MKRIIAGSRAFFSHVEGFAPHDHDELVICEDGEHQGFLVKRYFASADGQGCEFHIARVDKQRLIHWELRRGQAMSLGHYLLPEFCTEFGITMEDLEKLRPLRERLDYRHKYVGMIYDYYLENEAMTLTDEQRMAVYDEYKKERNI